MDGSLDELPAVQINLIFAFLREESPDSIGLHEDRYIRHSAPLLELCILKQKIKDKKHSEG